MPDPRRRRFDVLSLETLDVRVSALEEGLGEAVREIQANTRLTEEIHGDTKDIIEAVKWMSTTKRLAIFCAATIGGLAGLITAVGSATKFLGWW